MKTLSAVLGVLLLLACTKSPVAPLPVPPPPPPSETSDPFFAIWVRPAFDAAYPGARFMVRAHFISESDNPDPGNVVPDNGLAIRRDQCYQPAGGNNSTGIKVKVVVYVTPVVDHGAYHIDEIQPGDTLGPTYQSDTLDPSPEINPYPAPWGLDLEHPLVWKVKLGDGSAPIPALLPFATDTLLRLPGDKPDPCLLLFP